MERIKENSRIYMWSLIVCCISQQAYSQELTGSWRNELGSILVIDSLSQQGEIFGRYKSSSGVDGRVFPLQGWYNQGEKHKSIAISFTVRWNGYGSLTSWTGYRDIDDDGPYIKTLWHLIRPDEDEVWERVITNSSLFRPFKE